VVQGGKQLGHRRRKGGKAKKPGVFSGGLAWGGQTERRGEPVELYRNWFVRAKAGTLQTAGSEVRLVNKVGGIVSCGGVIQYRWKESFEMAETKSTPKGLELGA